MLNKTILPFSGKKQLIGIQNQILACDPGYRKYMERCRIWMPDLYFQYFRNWSFFLWGCRTGWSFKVETDPIHYTSIDHAVCNHFDTVKHWKNFLFWFWIILSGYTKFRSALWYHQCNRYLCIQGTASVRKYRNGFSGRLLSVHCPDLPVYCWQMWLCAN